MRLILADPGLVGEAGHHQGYSQALIAAARRRGIATLVLAHRELSASSLAACAPCLPVFGARYRVSGAGGALHPLLFGASALLPATLGAATALLLRRAGRLLRPGRADSFGQELAAALTDVGGTDGDFLVLPSVSAANLAGIADALDPTAIGVVAVVLRRRPEEMDATDPGPAPIADILRRMSKHFRRRLRLFADTAALATLWSRLVGFTVVPVPLPTVVPPMSDRQPPAAPHLVFAGGARIEKGYQLLPELVGRLNARGRFTIHSGPVGRGSDPLVQQAHRSLQGRVGPSLQLVERALGQDEYLRLVSSADLLLLPYDPTAYGERSSGVLSEARALGLPAIVPCGCWMEDAAGPAKQWAFDYPGGLMASVEGALDSLQALTVATRLAAPEWRRTHNPAALLDALLDGSAGL
jgi:hypothetical protein